MLPKDQQIELLTLIGQSSYGICKEELELLSNSPFWEENFIELYQNNLLMPIIDYSTGDRKYVLHPFMQNRSTNYLKINPDLNMKVHIACCEYYLKRLKGREFEDDDEEIRVFKNAKAIVMYGIL